MLEYTQLESKKWQDLKTQAAKQRNMLRLLQIYIHLFISIYIYVAKVYLLSVGAL